MKASMEMPHIKDELDYDFEEAIKIGNLSEAETWLKEQKETILRMEPEWVDELEQKLFEAYLDIDDIASAKRIAEESMSEESQEVRLETLNDLEDN